MRQKTLHLILTFHTTADALACEAACRKRNAPGRMIPVPRAVSAGCGMAWCASPDDRDCLSRILQEEKVTLQEMTECLL